MVYNRERIRINTQGNIITVVLQQNKKKDFATDTRTCMSCLGILRIQCIRFNNSFFLFIFVVAKRKKKLYKQKLQIKIKPWKIRY